MHFKKQEKGNTFLASREVYFPLSFGSTNDPTLTSIPAVKTYLTKPKRLKENTNLNQILSRSLTDLTIPLDGLFPVRSSSRRTPKLYTFAFIVRFDPLYLPLIKHTLGKVQIGEVFLPKTVTQGQVFKLNPNIKGHDSMFFC